MSTADVSSQSAAQARGATSVDVKLEVIEIPVAHADRAPNAGNGQGRLPANAKYGLVAVASVAAIGMF